MSVQRTFLPLETELKIGVAATALFVGAFVLPSRIADCFPPSDQHDFYADHPTRKKVRDFFEYFANHRAQYLLPLTIGMVGCLAFRVISLVTAGCIATCINTVHEFCTPTLKYFEDKKKLEEAEAKARSMKSVFCFCEKEGTIRGVRIPMGSADLPQDLKDKGLSIATAEQLHAARASFQQRKSEIGEHAALQERFKIIGAPFSA